MAIFWPYELLKPQAIRADIAPRNLRSPATESGFSQSVSNSAGMWNITFSNIPVYNTEMVKAWRAISAQADGQANPIILPMYDFLRAPIPEGLTYSGFCANIGKVLHSDNTPFDDDTSYENGGIDVTVAAGASVGATQIQVTKNTSGEIEPGQRFSINDRANQIKSIVSQDETSVTIKLSLPLREEIFNYEYLEFDRPRTKVILASDNEMFLDLKFNRQAFQTVKFVEWLGS